MLSAVSSACLDEFKTRVDNLLSVIYATVAGLDGIAIEDFSELVFVYIQYDFTIQFYFNFCATILPVKYLIYIFIWAEKLNIRRPLKMSP